MAHEFEVHERTVVIAEDPLGTLPVGASLTLTPVVFGSSDAVGVPDDVRNWGFFDGALLAVGFGDGTRLDMHGTAVMVAPGLAITAAHVMRAFANDLEEGAITCLCIGIRRNGASDAWKLRSLTHDDGDLAWLSLELCSAIGNDWCFSAIAATTRAPTQGEKLTIVGFRFDTQAAPSGSPNVLPPMAGGLTAAAGEVRAVYPRRRDAIMVSFPAIEIACGSRGGMSGGAVLDERGLLMGILSTGYDTEVGDGPSYAAWLISALTTKVNVPWPPGAYFQGVRVLDLPPSACRIVGSPVDLGVKGAP